MEDMKDVDMSPGQDQARGETLSSTISTNHEDGVIMQDKDIISSRTSDRYKKKESVPKESARSKVTVPHPFSLATDKRMSQERRRSVDLSPSKEKKTPLARVRRGSVDLTSKQIPKLSKSVSCVNNVQSPSDATKARSKMENGNGPAANSKVTKRSSTTRSKQSQIPVKQGGDATSTNQLGKYPTFKALPLPSFYHRTDPTSKLDVASKTFPRGNKPKKRDIGNGAKETITKLIKSTRRALNPSNETVKSVVAAA